MDRNVLSRATRASSELPSGYVLDEIVRMSYASPTASAEVLDFLDNALSHQPKVSGEIDALQKLNTLRVVRHLCERGSSEFRFGLQRRSVVLKSFLSYRAAPDALRGEAPSREVRLEAQRCLTALFETPKANGCRTTARLRAMEGFGSDTLYAGRHDDSHSSSTPFGAPAAVAGTFVSHPPSLMSSTRIKRAYGPDLNATSSTPGLLTGQVSEAVAAQAGQLIRQISVAASSISKFLPTSVRQHLEQQQPHQHQYHHRQPQASINRAPLSDASADSASLDPPSESFGIPTSEPQSTHWHLANHSTGVFKSRELSGGSSVSSSGCHPSTGPPTANPDHIREYVGTYKSPNSQLASECPCDSAVQSLPGSESAMCADTISRDTPAANLSQASGILLSASQVCSVESQSPASICTTDTDEYKRLSKEIELLCAESASARPAPARSALISFTRACCETPKVPVVPLLLSKLSTKIQHPIARHHRLSAANCWQAKLRVLAALAALIDPQFVSSSTVRETWREQIHALGREPILLLRLATPKCRQFADRLLEAVGSDVVTEKLDATTFSETTTKDSAPAGSNAPQNLPKLTQDFVVASNNCSNSISLLDDYEECLANWNDNSETFPNSGSAAPTVCRSSNLSSGSLLRDFDDCSSAQNSKNEQAASPGTSFNDVSKIEFQRLPEAITNRPLLGNKEAKAVRASGTQFEAADAIGVPCSTTIQGPNSRPTSAAAPLLDFLQSSRTDVEANGSVEPRTGEPSLLALLTSHSCSKQSAPQFTSASNPVGLRPFSKDEPTTRVDDMLEWDRDTALGQAGCRLLFSSSRSQASRHHTDHIESTGAGNVNAGSLLQELFPIGTSNSEPRTSEWNLAT